MLLTIVVHTSPVSCGQPLSDGTGNTQGESFYSFTIQHQMVDGDSFMAEMYETLVKLGHDDERTIAASSSKGLNPCIEVAVKQMDNMWAVVAGVRMEYERLVRNRDSSLHAMDAALVG